MMKNTLEYHKISEPKCNYDSKLNAHPFGNIRLIQCGTSKRRSISFAASLQNY
uniref:Uncharacterized protein n=1 Tax=Wuchereria bancrofti TaxID=6293 RepID=A0AAF5PPQ3_WUCBA